jgi:pilus assembly protein Flp/PilA
MSALSPSAEILCFLEAEEGVTAIEYGLLAALIAVALITTLQATGSSLGDIYTYWTNAVIAVLTL